ncbi:hypothetical protein TNCV_4140051 [Trichonephila clavipes]|nr:hypothetical protein TNCV_4140051 [Trichonephila clavipes]
MRGRLSCRQFERTSLLNTAGLFSGTKLELMTRRPQVHYLDHYSTVSLMYSKSSGWRGVEVNKELENLQKKFLFARSSCGREFKAMDMKTIGVSPRRFESYRLRVV